MRYTNTNKSNAEVMKFRDCLHVSGPGVNYAIGFTIEETGGIPTVTLNAEDLAAFYELDDVSFSKHERGEFDLYLCQVAEGSC